MTTYGYSKKGAQRIETAVKRVERAGPLLVDQKTGASRTKELRRRVCRFVSQDGDTITVTLPGGTSPSGDVVVAKPYLIRRTPFDGSGRGNFTYVYSSDFERTSTSTIDASTEDQIVVPSYEVGDEIHIRRVNGGDLIGDGLSDILWIDCNESRCWAKVSS